MKTDKKSNIKPATPSFTVDADSEAVRHLAEGRHGDPFSILGRHQWKKREVFRCFLPRTARAWLEDKSRPMERVPGTDLFEYLAPAGEVPVHYRVIRENDRGVESEFADPYSFWPQLQSEEMDAFHHGRRNKKTGLPAFHLKYHQRF